MALTMFECVRDPRVAVGDVQLIKVFFQQTLVSSCFDPCVMEFVTSYASRVTSRTTRFNYFEFEYCSIPKKIFK